jgi:hypothetical protein
MADDVQKLLVQVDASVELLRRNLLSGEQQVVQFQKRTQTNLTIVERQFQKMGTTSAAAFGKMRAGLATLGISLGVGAIIAASKAALEYAGHLGELAGTLGLTTKDLQEFSYAAGQVGVSQEELETGIQKLTISMGKAQLGSKAQADAFKAIGISVDQLKGKNAGDVFRMIADKLETVSDRSQRAAVEVALFGKSGAKLDNLLSGAQGRLSELADAAQRLGIVLSDEQIRHADEAADKLRALKTVLEARIAGVVADNANSILTLANALVTLVGKLGAAIRAYQAFLAVIRIGQGKLAALDPTNSAQNRAWGRGEVAAGEAQLRDLQRQRAGGSSAADRAARFRAGLGMGPPPATPSGVDIPHFLGGGGSGKDHSAEDADRKRKEQLDKEFRIKQENIQAQIDELEARKDASNDYVEQTTLAIAIRDKEQEIYNLAQDHAVETGEINKALAVERKAQFAKTDAIKRQKILADEQVKRAQEVADIEKADYDRKVELLGMQADLARTADERRKIQHEILDAEIAYKRKVLEATAANPAASDADRENARRDLTTLGQDAALKGRLIDRANMNPLQQWVDSVPKSAAEITEALQGIESQGLDRLTDSLTDVITGTKSLGEAFKEISHEIIADIIRMTIKMLIFRAISSAIGGGVSGGLGQSAFPVVGGVDPLAPLPARASGGPVEAGRAYIVGEKRPELFVPSTNGLIVPRVPNLSGMRGGGRSGESRTVVELRLKDDMLDARIVQGAGQVVVATAPSLVKAATQNTLRVSQRRTLSGRG